MPEDYFNDDTTFTYTKPEVITEPEVIISPLVAESEIINKVPINEPT